MCRKVLIGVYVVPECHVRVFQENLLCFGLGDVSLIFMLSFWGLNSCFNWYNEITTFYERFQVFGSVYLFSTVSHMLSGIFM